MKSLLFCAALLTSVHSYGFFGDTLEGEYEMTRSQMSMATGADYLNCPELLRVEAFDRGLALGDKEQKLILVDVLADRIIKEVDPSKDAKAVIDDKSAIGEGFSLELGFFGGLKLKAAQGGQYKVVCKYKRD